MDITHFATFYQWVDIFFKVVGTMFCIWLYFERRNDKTNAKVAAIELRVTKLETEVSKNPTHEHIGGVYDKIHEVSASLSVLSNDFAGVKTLLTTLEKQIERMDTFWRNTNP